MTRQEFIDNVVCFEDLRNFCYDETRADEFFENIYDESGKDELVNELMCEYVRDNDWIWMRNWLSDIPDGYEWYRFDDYGDWHVLDDCDFDEIKQEILDSYDYFEEDDGDDDNDEEEFAVYEHPPITFDELFAYNHNVMTAVPEKEPESDVPILM